jgi:hypothetical protein
MKHQENKLTHREHVAMDVLMLVRALVPDTTRLIEFREGQGIDVMYTPSRQKQRTRMQMEAALDRESD